MALATPVPGPGEARSSAFARGIQSRVRRFIEENQVAFPGETALVAISGGGDSTAMLLLLSNLAAEYHWQLTAAHFDHRLRTPQEAAADRQFVEDLCQSAGVPLLCGAGDVSRRARRQGESIEQAARVLRYRFLGSAARRSGASVVFLGHTLDDLAETVLLHLIRGSGVDGLVGMRPRGGWPLGRGPAAGRPLLALRRAETQRYCRELGITPREDPTNELLFAARNRVRHELMPVLRRFNPRVEQALARLAQAAAADVDLLESLAADALRRVASRSGGALVLDLDSFRSLAPGLRPRVLRKAMETVLRTTAGIEAAHINSLLQLAGSRPGSLSLPRGLIAVRDSRSLTLHRGEPPQAQPLPETPLAIPGITGVDGWRFEARVVDGPVRPGSTGAFEAALDAAAVAGGLVVRSRRPGDRMRPLGVGGEKKLQDLFVDAKIPRQQRDGVPVVVAPWGIAWAVGLRVDERAAVTPRSRRVLLLAASRTDRC